MRPPSRLERAATALAAEPSAATAAREACSAVAGAAPKNIEMIGKPART